MSELLKRVDQLAKAIDASGERAAREHETLRHLCARVRWIAGHCESAAKQGAYIELSEKGDPVYCRPDDD